MSQDLQFSRMISSSERQKKEVPLGSPKALPHFKSQIPNFYGNPNVLTRKIAICARVTGWSGQ
jgi:hypothetical protein